LRGRARHDRPARTARWARTIIYTIGDPREECDGGRWDGGDRSSDHRGTLCPKGSSLQQEIMNDRRLLKPLVRRPVALEWQDISWDDAISEIRRG